MSQFGKSFEPTGATVNEAVTAAAETVSLAGRLSDRDGAIRVANIGTVTIFITLDGTTPTVSNAIPLVANTAESFSMPAGKTDVKHIAAGAGSTIYVTPGRGI
jgi:hypothetical protein